MAPRLTATGRRRFGRLSLALFAALLSVGCAAPTPGEVRAVPPVYSVSAQAKSPEFCSCLLNEADERVKIGVFQDPVSKRLVPASNGCELIVGDPVPYAIVLANRHRAQIRMMRDITRPKDVYISDHWADKILVALQDSVAQCFDVGRP